MKMRKLVLGLAGGVIVVGALSVSHYVFAQRGPNMGGPGHMYDRDYWQPGWMRRHMWGRHGGSPEMRARRQRHWTFMHDGVPKAYDRAQSPLKPTIADISAGGTLYVEHCASCHGKSGMGDGEAGKSLTPSPTLLAWMIQRPVAVDEYLVWTISDGGAAFKTDMPAFKNTLSRDEVWKIIAYMRAGFPAVTKKKN